MRFIFFLVMIAAMPDYIGAQTCLSQDLLNAQLHQNAIVAGDRARIEAFTRN